MFSGGILDLLVHGMMISDIAINEVLLLIVKVKIYLYMCILYNLFVNFILLQATMNMSTIRGMTTMEVINHRDPD